MWSKKELIDKQGSVLGVDGAGLHAAALLSRPRITVVRVVRT